MIQRSNFIESNGAWLSTPLASPGDSLLCAFVSLRLLTSDIPELLSSRSDSHRDDQYHIRPLIKAMRDQIERWQRQWTARACQGMLFGRLTEMYRLMQKQSVAIPFSSHSTAIIRYLFSSQYPCSPPFPDITPPLTWNLSGLAIVRRLECYSLVATIPTAHVFTSPKTQYM